MTNLIYRTCAAALLGIAASSAFAQISSVGPFAGTYVENFDEFPTQDQQLFLPNPLTTFGGEGTLTITNTDPNAVDALAVYNPPDHPFGNYMPNSGDFFAVTQTTGDVINIAFNDPMSQFGGYFGQDPVTVTFLDAHGNVIGGGNYTPANDNNDGTLEWLGWSSTEAFTTVEIANPNSTTIDSFQATPSGTPEPCTMVVMLGGLGSIARRKFRRG